METLNNYPRILFVFVRANLLFPVIPFLGIHYRALTRLTFKEQAEKVKMTEGSVGVKRQ